jgi:ribonucleoside-diphosphate reductase alpha chain
MRLEQENATACQGLSGVSPEAVMTEVRRNLYDGILLHELGLAQTMAARSLVEQEPNYAYVSARLLLNNLRDEALTFVLPGSVGSTQKHSHLRYEEYFPKFVRRAIDLEILDKELGSFDLPRLVAALKPERDGNFQFLGQKRPVIALSPAYVVPKQESKFSGGGGFAPLVSFANII